MAQTQKASERHTRRTIKIRDFVVCVFGIMAVSGCAHRSSSSSGVLDDMLIQDEQSAFARSHRLVLRRFDLNGDKKTDVFKFYRSGEKKLLLLARKEIDLNHDGRVDMVREYDDKQRISTETLDLDFDGHNDEISFYKDGSIVRKEIDLNDDQKADVTKYYVKGQLKRVESDRDGDGSVDTWEFFEEDQLDRIGVDANHDGKPDKWERKRK